MSTGKLICGRSRAGKTTYSRRYKNVIHLDHYGIPPKNYEEVKKEVAQSIGDVIVEGVYDTAERRKALLESFNGDRKICIWLDTPQDVIKSRFRHSLPNHPRPFEPLTLSEGWDEIIIIGEEHDQSLGN